MCVKHTYVSAGVKVYTQKKSTPRSQLILLMTTEADYDFMKAVFVEMNKQTQVPENRDGGVVPVIVFNPHKKKAFSQVRARLFTINLNLRPELPLPQELTDKIYHEALMSEFMEKLPKFKDTDRFRYDQFYKAPKVFSFWIDLCYQLKRHSNNRTIRTTNGRDGGGGWVNKKEFLIGILTDNGVVCDKKWTCNRLVKAL